MWPEIDIAKKENRHEIILTGSSVNERINKEGLDTSVFTLIGLNYLNINGTSINEIPDDISKLTGLQTLVLHSNKLSTINPIIGVFNKLKVLDLSGNELEEVPDIFENLQQIVTINISRNKLNKFPALSKNSKLSVLDLSNNKLVEFPDVCKAELANLSDIKLNGNEIIAIPDIICSLSALKVLDVSSNKISAVPGNLIDCGKLKEVNLKGNPISDRRLLKLIDQCRTKQILDYVKQHCPKTKINIKDSNKKNKVNRKLSEEDEAIVEHEYKYKINVLYAKDNCEVTVEKNVENVRKHIACCVVKDVTFDDTTFKKFIQLQNKLHETLCDRRNAATIATHDFKKLSDGNLTYTTMQPQALKIKPLKRTVEMTGKELFEKLQTEAQNLRKEKKRNTYSGIHKYLYLIEGRPEYPCLLNSKGEVVSFPPITNSDISKIEVNSTEIFLEVTSSVSLPTCRKILDTLIREMVLLLETNLTVLQIKTVDEEGNMKNVYPSRNDLLFEAEKLVQVLRE
ncbi:hypothetical protein HHI36_021142 [Cryptolaemus montrouzieri]|uniref:B3/B4 tRNA-binding domain-containing protein n=1 Tax=Cryptolaemus montrouzieri TaxID=559131 RepID=A0ABD2MVX5_9CUCU